MPPVTKQEKTLRGNRGCSGKKAEGYLNALPQRNHRDLEEKKEKPVSIKPLNPLS